LLLAYDVGLGMSRLRWLTIPAVDATASAVKTSIEKLMWLRSMGAHLGTVKLLGEEGFRGSLGPRWGGCGAVVRRLLGPVR
jgi:hypothetical protein